MATLKSYRDEKFVTYCANELKDYVDLYPGIDTALIATPDGFEIASYAHKKTYSADKLAAVGSSLFALGASLVEEFDLKDCKSVILDSERGKVYISTIQSMQTSVILMIQTSELATLGNIVHGARRLNEKIALKLNLVSQN